MNKATKDPQQFSPTLTLKWRNNLWQPWVLRDQTTPLGIIDCKVRDYIAEGSAEEISPAAKRSTFPRV